MTMTVSAIRRVFEIGTVIPMSLTLAVCVLVSPAMAQDESVKPGVNKKYENPDIQKSMKSLESENREVFKHRKQIIALLELKPGLDVADVGAGTGFYSRMLAKEVGPDGIVYAVELPRSFVENLKRIATEESLPNLKPAQCNEKPTTLLVESVALVFIADQRGIRLLRLFRSLRR